MAGFEKYPPGWSKDSVIKFAKTLSKKSGKGPKDEGWFKLCVNKMKDHMDQPEGFCASVKDIAHKSTFWRGKDKPPKEVKSDVRLHKNVKVKETIELYLKQLGDA